MIHHLSSEIGPDDCGHSSEMVGNEAKMRPGERGRIGGSTSCVNDLRPFVRCNWSRGHSRY